jgi:hypothetical protein
MTALSAPDSVRGENIVSIVILVVSILSALGAAWMILSFTVGYSLMCELLYSRRILTDILMYSSSSRLYGHFDIS